MHQWDDVPAFLAAKCNFKDCVGFMHYSCVVRLCLSVVSLKVIILEQLR